MPIVFHCVNCNGRMKVPEALKGKRGKCTHCGSVVQVPEAASPSSSSGSGDLTPLTLTESSATQMVVPSATCALCGKAFAPQDLLIHVLKPKTGKQLSRRRFGRCPSGHGTSRSSQA